QTRDQREAEGGHAAVDGVRGRGAEAGQKTGQTALGEGALDAEDRDGADRRREQKAHDEAFDEDRVEFSHGGVWRLAYPPPPLRGYGGPATRSRPVTNATARETTAGSCTMRVWPRPWVGTSVAPGHAAAIASPLSKGTSASSRSWITRSPARKPRAAR